MSSSEIKEEEAETIFTRGCLSCKAKGTKDEITRTIYENKRLGIRIVLRIDNQCWLGRAVIIFDKHVSPEEYWSRADMVLATAQVIALLNKAYKEAFGMTMSNIAQLGNLTEDHEGKKTSTMQYHHVHFHYIPRYEVPPLFEYDPKTGDEAKGQVWPDPQWGLALNIDPKAGLPIIKPHAKFIDVLAAKLRATIASIEPDDAMFFDDLGGDNNCKLGDRHREVGDLHCVSRILSP